MKLSQRQPIFTTIILTAILFISIYATLPETVIVNGSPDYWPTNGWMAKPPVEVNISSSKLADMDAYINESSILLKSLLIIRHGYLVYERYFLDNNESSLQEIYSITKSFTSALIGIAVGEGYLNVSQKMLDFFPNRTIANLDARKEKITIKHLLTMTSGLKWNEVFNDIPFAQSDDPLQYVLDLPMAHEPGTVFNYNSGAVHILTAILQNVTGKTALEYAEEKIFQPLGFQDYNWKVDPQGIYFGGFGLKLLPRDLAKFGFLYLNNGTWDDQQIIPAAWVVNSTTKKVTVSSSINYGYLWWLYPKLNYYVASGFNGQEIFVCPKYNLIVVTTAWQLEGAIFNLYENYILPSLYDFPYTPTSSAVLFIAALTSPLPFVSLGKKIFFRKKK
ncbi:MAG: beta-lactamase family protein [Candidatus Heimdallarchaeota archaeon]|nr:beta-lactamase family protein [Candidatus Heimdallarchaeota archaeon]